MKKLFVFLALIIFSFSWVALSEEDGGKPAEKGAGGEYYKHEANLTGLNSKIEKNEEDVRQLIDQKNKTNDDGKVRDIVSQIQVELKNRKENITKYNKELATMKYQFPDKGKEIKTKYKHFDENRVKQFEDKVDQLLSNVYENVKQKYDQTK